MIAEVLKGNCSVTFITLVIAVLLLVRLLLLTCVEQIGNNDMSDDVKRKVAAIMKQNRDEPEHRRAEVTAMVASIKQVFVDNAFFLRNFESSVCDNHCC